MFAINRPTEFLISMFLFFLFNSGFLFKYKKKVVKHHSSTKIELKHSRLLRILNFIVFTQGSFYFFIEKKNIFFKNKKKIQSKDDDEIR